MPPKHSKRSKVKLVKTPKERKGATRLPSGVRNSESSALSLAVTSLQNSAVTTVVETKSPNGGKPLMQSKISYPAELLLALRGMFPATKAYRFELHYVTTQTSSAGGSMLGSETINPSVTSFAEWSALSALFDECKAVASTFTWCNLYLPVGAITPCTIVCAFDEQSLASSAPASYLSVLRLAESYEFHSVYADKGSGRHAQSRVLASRAWCNTATPATASPIGGFAGSWSFGNNDLAPASTSIATTTIRVVGLFRCRA